MRSRIVVFLMLLCFMALVLAAQDVLAKPPHDSIASFEGTKTCGTCHAKVVKDVAESLHYHQCGPAPFVKDIPKGQCAGQMQTF